MRRPIMITSFAAPARRGALRFLSAAALVAMVVPLEQMPVQAAGALTKFDVQGASFAFSQVCNNAFVGAIGCGTTPLANNDPGQVVGTYTDAGLVQHGFLRARNGEITTFEAPGAGAGPGQGTVAFSINNAGLIAGAFQDSNNVYHGFLRFPWGYFEPLLDAPGAGTGPGQGTLAFSINMPGTTTTGIYIDADGTYHGFVQTPSGMVETFDASNSPPNFTYPCEETCVNPNGTVTGDFFDPTIGLPTGFVRSPSGHITPITVPNAAGTLAASINTRGVIAGYFWLQNGVCVNGSQNYEACGFVLYPNGSFDTFADSAVINNAAVIGTEPVSINSAGATTGISVVFVDGNFVYHGFERDADGHFMHFDAADAGTGNAQGTRPSTNNSSGEVTGWYITSDNGTPNTWVYHGFVWQPSASPGL
jgi:hypothetical protein